MYLTLRSPSILRASFLNSSQPYSCNSTIVGFVIRSQVRLDPTRFCSQNGPLNGSEIGELYELEKNNKQAIVYFERFAELFQGEEVITSASQCKLKVAMFSAQLE
ncbi:unnamed protein product [Camellia sinensis]